MPPWQPARGYGASSFQGEPRLTDVDIETLRRWAAAGAAAGGAREAAPLPPAAEWPLGEPDLVVSMAEPYTVAPGTGVAYRNFALAVDLSAPRWVRAVDGPAGRGGGGSRSARSDNAGRHRHRTAAPGRTRMLAGLRRTRRSDQGRFPPGDFLAFGRADGRTDPRNPRRTLRWRIDPGTDHPPAARPEVPRAAGRCTGRPSGLYFSDAPPASASASASCSTPRRSTSRPASRPTSGGRPLHPAGRRWRWRASTRTSTAWARPIEVAADTFPTAPRMGLLRIDDWRFDWQDGYRYTEPVRLPEGTLLRARFPLRQLQREPAQPVGPADPGPLQPGRHQRRGPRYSCRRWRSARTTRQPWSRTCFGSRPATTCSACRRCCGSTRTTTAATPIWPPATFP